MAWLSKIVNGSLVKVICRQIYPRNSQPGLQRKIIKLELHLTAVMVQLFRSNEAASGAVIPIATPLLAACEFTAEIIPS